MIIRLPSRFCSKCGGKGLLRKSQKVRNIFVLVCNNITKSGNREVMTLRAYNKRIGKLRRKERAKINISEELKDAATR